MTDHETIARCVRFVGVRLADMIRREERQSRKALGKQIRAFELLAAACLAEAARTKSSVPAGPGLPEPRTRPDARTDPALRGAWEPPDR